MSVQLDKLFIRNFERQDGSELEISQSEIGDVGCVVWDAAIVLAAFLETPDVKKALAGRRVVELGAGTGLVGLQAACGGAACEITDLPEFVPLIQLNIDNNAALVTGRAATRPLTWGEDVTDFLPPPDYILLADCIYYPGSIEPLVDTISKLSGATTTVYCCYEERTTDNKPMLQKQFFELMAVYFNSEKIPLEQQDPNWRSEDIHIHRFTRR